MWDWVKFPDGVIPLCYFIYSSIIFFGGFSSDAANNYFRLSALISYLNAIV
jgi:hypothetical protein